MLYYSIVHLHIVLYTVQFPTLRAPIFLGCDAAGFGPLAES